MSGLGKLLPHAGDSVMIERVLSSDDAQVRVATTLHRSIDNPLRRHGRLAAVHLVEFAAQAMALHGALLDQAAGRATRAALLVSVRDLVLGCEHLEKLEGELEITARALQVSARSWQYGFSVTHAGREIASGRLAAMADG
jgi:predicted hotdog family 3-hydroxylacyl-ACP dehydratase